MELTLADSSVEVLHYCDFVSGAMIANIVDRAKKNAIKDFLAGTDKGLTVQHLLSAVDAEYRENEDLPNTANPDEWTRISGHSGKKVIRAQVIAQAVDQATDEAR